MTQLTLVLAGTGKTGRRVAHRLTAHGVPVRLGSRSARPPFDWHDPRSAAIDRPVRYVPVSIMDYAEAVASVVPAEEALAMATLFAKVLDGRNSRPTDDVERVLGRPARDFREFAGDAAATGAWS